MSLKIKELPETERPYEKLELYGEKNLSNAELLAIIIKSGTKEETKGIGRVKAIQLKAVCELAIRMSKPSNYKKIQIKSTENIANLVMEELKFQKREYVKLFLLNTKNEILKNIDVAVGGTNFANVSMKEIIGEALKIKAPKIILVHNHPTGDPTPSQMDIKFTDKLYNAAKMFDIELLDHIVIGNMNFRSVFVETQNLVENMKNSTI